MSILYVCIAFGVVLGLMALRRPLWVAVIGGIVAVILLFQVQPIDCLLCVTNVLTTQSSLSVLITMYLIAYLQRMLEARDQLVAASKDLDGLLANRRASALGSCVFIGLLPSPAAVLICGDLMDNACEGALDPERKAFATSWIRHIPESVIPTFPAVLLMSQLSGVGLPEFILGMCAPVVVMALIGYVYLRRIPKKPSGPPSQNRPKDLLNLVKHLWSILLILVLILAFNVPVVFAALASILICIPVYRFKPRDIATMVKTAFERKMMVNVFLVLVLASFIAHVGVLEQLPAALEGLPIPGYLLFCLVFFLGCLVSGSTGIIAMGTPLAFAAVPGAGMPLMVLLMCVIQAASQIQPTHICLVMICEKFGVGLGALIKRTLPWAALFVAFSLLYYNALLFVGF